LFESKLLSGKTKIILYKVLVNPVALNACRARATTKSDERKLKVFERKILRNKDIKKESSDRKKYNEGKY